MKKLIISMFMLLLTIFLFAQIPLEKIVVVPTNPPANFKISVWINKGEGAYYYPGENITIFFRSNRDAYVVLYDILPTGEVHILFPNSYDQANYITAGQIYTIPRQGYAFVIENIPGKEYLQLIASQTQFAVYDSWHRSIVSEMFPMVAKDAGEYFSNFAQKIIVVPDQPQQPVWTSATTYLFVN